MAQSEFQMSVANNDQVQTAINNLRPVSNFPNPLAPVPYSKQDIENSRESALQAERDAASNRLAEDALLDNPAAMRKMFPQVYKDISLNHNDHLDEEEIKQALKGGAISQDERNFLTVLKDGYKQYSYDPKSALFKGSGFQPDFQGVSAGSLAMIDKAVNRQIPEDPYFSSTFVKATVLNTFLGAAVTAGSSCIGGDSGKSQLYFAIAGALIGGGYVAGKMELQKHNGTEDKMYDQVKTDYQSFAAEFKKKQLTHP